jgi:hypothetical protein
VNLILQISTIIISCCVGPSSVGINNSLSSLQCLFPCLHGEKLLSVEGIGKECGTRQVLKHDILGSRGIMFLSSRMYCLGLFMCATRHISL